MSPLQTVFSVYERKQERIHNQINEMLRLFCTYPNQYIENGNDETKLKPLQISKKRKKKGEGEKTHTNPPRTKRSLPYSIPE